MKNKLLIFILLVSGVFIGVCNAQENTHKILSLIHISEPTRRS